MKKTLTFTVFITVFIFLILFVSAQDLNIKNLITPITIANGGTGAGTAVGARTNLGILRQGSFLVTKTFADFGTEAVQTKQITLGTIPSGARITSASMKVITNFSGGGIGTYTISGDISSGLCAGNGILWPPFEATVGGGDSVVDGFRDESDIFTANGLCYDPAETISATAICGLVGKTLNMATTGSAEFFVTFIYVA